MTGFVPEREDEALVRVVLADPDDDGPRLVYADRLLERGEYLGELITLQCALRRLTEGDPRRDAMRRREQHLLDQNLSPWRKGLRRRRDWSRWNVVIDRGFIDAIDGASFASLDENAEALLWHPLRILGIQTVGDSPRIDALRDLLRKAFCARVATVRLHLARDVTVSFDAAALTAALDRASPAALGGPAQQQTASLPHPSLMPAARTVLLTHATPEQLAELAAAPPATLEDVSFGGSNLDARSVAPLVTDPRFDSLVEIAAWTLEDGAARAILASERLPNLRRLRLQEGRLAFDRSLSRAIATSSLLPRLESLRVTAALDDELARALAERAVKLTRLEVELVDPGALRRLLDSGLSGRIQSLALWGGRGQSAAVLAAANLPRLEQLQLGDVALDASDAAALVSRTSFPQLRSFSHAVSPAPDVRAILATRWPAYARRARRTVSRQ